ncbi:MAG: hypothetical protein IT355_13195 [Gemmatimonadaceae bacterium]|nr:hypothetical protein [Gemmatimonadaceae bacterium]
MAQQRTTATLSIREARAYLHSRHGISMSRATFWRIFLPPGVEWIGHWNATLERRGASVGWTFLPTDVDRMATCYLAGRSGAPVWYAVADGTTGLPLKSPRARLSGPGATSASAGALADLMK